MKKLIQQSQKNTTKLDAVVKSQENVVSLMNEQRTQISEIKSILERHETEGETEKKKGKHSGKNEFYQVNQAMFYNVIFLSCYFINNHLLYILGSGKKTCS